MSLTALEPARSVEDITHTLRTYRHHKDSEFINSSAINYANELHDLEYAFSQSDIQNTTRINALIELTKHFPYIMSQDKEVRNKLWDILSENADKVHEEDQFQKASKGYIWTHIAIHLEFFFFDKNLHIEPQNKIHPLFTQLIHKRKLIIDYINSILINKSSIIIKKQDKIQIDNEFSTVMQALNYLDLEHKNNNALHEKISKLIVDNAEVISNVCCELIDSLHSDSSSTSSKPWVRALHFYRVCSRNMAILTQQRITIFNLARLIETRYEAIPGHLLKSWTAEFIKLDILRALNPLVIKALLHKNILPYQSNDAFARKSNLHSTLAASSANLSNVMNAALSTRSPRKRTHFLSPPMFF